MHVIRFTLYVSMFTHHVDGFHSVLARLRVVAFDELAYVVAPIFVSF